LGVSAPLSTDKLREHIAGKLYEVLAYVESGISMLSVGDDVGAKYAISKMASNFKFAVDRFAELERETLLGQRKEEAFDQIQRDGRSIRDREAKPAGWGGDEHVERFAQLAREPTTLGE
jgi:hypothetical protein